MPLQWRTNILELLKEHGYTTYRIRKEKIFSESSVQNFRHNKPASWNDIETICRLTNKQPGKLIEFVKDDPKDNKKQ